MEKQSFSFSEFCNLNNISRTKLYDLLKNGLGPKTMMIGRRRLISMESAKEWRERMTNLSSNTQEVT